VDVNVNRSNPVIGAASRSFSPEPDSVAASAAAFIEGHHAHGVLTALKHFPGHGSSHADSHFGFVDVTATWSEAELVPYTALIGEGLADVVMAAHVFNANLDSEFPASLSKATISGLLRAKLGFDGVVMTDSLQMGAITLHWTFEDSIRLAIEAGADILAYTNALLEPDLCDRVHRAVRSLVDTGVVPVSRLVESFERIQRLKARLPSPADGG
ncbi:MAG: glycoside hydrolase family 3 N-terminal domain-containing protein, partial [Dehalococcoidia bacterium]